MVVMTIASFIHFFWRPPASCPVHTHITAAATHTRDRASLAEEQKHIRMSRPPLAFETFEKKTVARRARMSNQGAGRVR
jgi:hypothetical protein